MKIDNQLKDICPNAVLGIIYFKAKVEKSNDALLKELSYAIEELEKTYSIQNIVDNIHIKSTREAYLKLGKSPSSYRNAAEAMLRRIVKGKGLYQINNIVEINNLISITSGYSIGTYDLENLTGDIILKKANLEEKYQGIGKELINIENLPTLYDAEGPFGNPTSDSRRAMVNLGDKNLMMVIYGFDDTDIEVYMNQAITLLEKYGNASEIKKEIIK